MLFFNTHGERWLIKGIEYDIVTFIIGERRLIKGTEHDIVTFLLSKEGSFFS